MERRSFLKGMAGVVGAAAAAEGCKKLGNVLPQPTLPDRSFPVVETGPTELTEPHETISWSWGNNDEFTPEQTAELSRLYRELRAIQGTVQQIFDRYDVYTLKECPLEAHSELKALFLRSSFKETFAAACDTLVQYKDQHLYDSVLQLFSNCSCQGLFYKQMLESSARLHIPIPLLHNGGYYASRVRDYLPTGNAIWSADIDPRNVTWIDEQHRRELVAQPGWSGNLRKIAFRTLAQNEEVQRLAKQADLTLAEYFSLLKAIHHEHLIEGIQEEQVIPATSVETFATRLLAHREAFMHTNLADRTTEQAIIFYGRDRENVHRGSDEHEWQDILEAAGVAGERVRAFGTTMEHNVQEVRDQLYSAIAHSRGKTFVSFDSHGNKDVLGVDNERGQDHLTTQGLAQALIQRLQAAAHPDGIKNMTLCIEACFTFDFAKNLVQEIRDQWNAIPNPPFPTSQIQFPAILTAVQEDSQALHNYKIVSLLSQQLKGVEGDRCLSGKRILQVVQPISYQCNDITCFAAGKNTEFARRRQPREEAAQV